MHNHKWIYIHRHRLRDEQSVTNRNIRLVVTLVKCLWVRPEVCHSQSFLIRELTDLFFVILNQFTKPD